MGRPPRRHDSGFSMPEVMVSSILLTMVVLNSTNIYMRSQGSLRNTSLRDAVNARIAQDLEDLRNRSWRFGCEDGLDISSSDLSNLRTQYPGLSDTQLRDNIASSCTGDMRYADRPTAYKSGRSPNGAPAPLTEYTNHCSANKMAVLMQSKDSAFASGIQTLALASNSQNAALATANISINRTISLDATDQNRIIVSYSTASGSPVSVKMNTSIVPQALGWCT